MNISRTRQYKLNMGNYESVELSATISVKDVDIFDEDELPSMTPDEVLEALQEHAERYLDQMLEQELKQAGEVSEATASLLFEKTPPTRKTEKARSRR